MTFDLCQISQRIRTHNALINGNFEFCICTEAAALRNKDTCRSRVRDMADYMTSGLTPCPVSLPKFVKWMTQEDGQLAWLVSGLRGTRIRVQFLEKS